MVASKQDLRLDDRHDAILLRFVGIFGKALAVFEDRLRGGQCIALYDKGRAPLSESRPSLFKILEALRQSEKPLGEGLLRALRKFIEPLVYLDPRRDPARGEHLGEPDFLFIFLLEGLREEDHPREILLDA